MPNLRGRREKGLGFFCFPRQENSLRGQREAAMKQTLLLVLACLACASGEFVKVYAQVREAVLVHDPGLKPMVKIMLCLYYSTGHQWQRSRGFTASSLALFAIA